MATLTYCTNLFPAESLADVRSVLTRFAHGMRARLGGIDRIPVGLYLSARACEELEAPDALDAFENELRSLAIRAVTVNAFPFGGFHDAIVKERVFVPAWDDPARRKYTESACRILARLLPRGATGSVSTHSGYYKNPGVDPARDERVARAWLRTAVELSRIEEETGRRIILSIEPEPFSRLETVAEILAFLEFTFGPMLRRMCAEWSVTQGWLEAAARRHLGVCFDCCHQAVEFEDGVGAISRLRAAGIQIGKIQASIAPALTAGTGDAASRAAGLARLAAFDEPRYLHQTFGRGDDGSIVKFTDLAPALADREFLTKAREIRTHFHLPIFLENAGDPSLGTTRGELERVLLNCSNSVDCIEIETYTLSALPTPPTGDAAIFDTIAAEWSYAEKLLARAPKPPG